MLIAQISDMHVMEEGWLLFGRVDTNAMLERAVAFLRAHRPAIDAVLMTGDLTNDGTPGQFAALRARLDPLAMPVLPVMGNHDDRAAYRAAFAGWAGADGAADAPVRYVHDLAAARVVVLDSQIPGEPGGRLGEAQLAWLDDTLAAAPERPTLVAVHHPPFDTGIDHMDAMRLADGAALGAVLARHGQVERVLAGHVHRPISRRFAGTVAMTAPSSAHQVALQLAPGAPSRWTFDPPALLLHRVDPDGAVVTHQAYPAADPALYAFGDAHALRAEGAAARPMKQGNPT